MKVAKYRCEDKGCGATWEWWVDHNPGDCPSCGGHYYKWLNYEALFPSGAKPSDG